MAGGLQECMRYIEERPVFDRLLRGFLEKYKSLGRVGGSVRLSLEGKEEAECLEGFLGRRFSGRKTASISAGEFQEALDKSRFCGVKLENLLRECFGAEMMWKKEERLKRVDERTLFFLNMAEKWKGTPGEEWLSEAWGDKAWGWGLLLQQYELDKEALEQRLGAVMAAMDHLPARVGGSVRMAVFAAEITGDPHFFDEGTEAGRLLENALSHYFRAWAGEAKRQKAGTSHVEQRNEVLFRAGLIKDDISNYTTAYEIHCRKKDGSLHLGIEGYWKERQPVHISLWTIGGLGEAFVDKDEDQWVFVVENPAVFGVLAQAADVPLVCVNGQPRLSSLLLLDLLWDHGCRFQYAGDFDPEGLKIADGLKRRYGESLSFWHYAEEDYRKALSQVRIGEKRMAKLRGLRARELTEMGRMIRETGRAAYQEGLVPVYLEELRNSRIEGIPEI